MSKVSSLVSGDLTKLNAITIITHDELVCQQKLVQKFPMSRSVYRLSEGTKKLYIYGGLEIRLNAPRKFEKSSCNEATLCFYKLVFTKS